MLKWNKEMGFEGMVWICLTQDRGQAAGTCEHGNEPSGSIKCGELEGLCSVELVISLVSEHFCVLLKKFGALFTSLLNHSLRSSYLQPSCKYVEING
jgi:hypothetical protein